MDQIEDLIDNTSSFGALTSVRDLGPAAFENLADMVVTLKVGGSVNRTYQTDKLIRPRVEELLDADALPLLQKLKVGGGPSTLNFIEEAVTAEVERAIPRSGWPTSSEAVKAIQTAHEHLFGS